MIVVDEDDEDDDSAHSSTTPCMLLSSSKYRIAPDGSEGKDDWAKGEDDSMAVVCGSDLIFLLLRFLLGSSSIAIVRSLFIIDS